MHMKVQILEQHFSHKNTFKEPESKREEKPVILSSLVEEEKLGSFNQNEFWRHIEVVMASTSLFDLLVDLEAALEVLT